MAKKGGHEDLGREVAEEEGVVIEGTAVIIAVAAMVIKKEQLNDLVRVMECWQWKRVK